VLLQNIDSRYFASKISGMCDLEQVLGQSDAKYSFRVSYGENIWNVILGLGSFALFDIGSISIVASLDSNYANYKSFGVSSLDGLRA
jgi:hypothetical protein